MVKHALQKQFFKARRRELPQEALREPDSDLDGSVEQLTGGAVPFFLDASKGRRFEFLDVGARSLDHFRSLIGKLRACAI